MTTGEHPINGTVPLLTEGTILIAGHEGIDPDLINRQQSQTPSTLTLEADTSNMSSLGSSFGSDDYSHEYIKQYSSSSKGSKAPRTPTSDDEMCKVSSSSSSSRFLTVDNQVILMNRVITVNRVIFTKDCYIKYKNMGISMAD